MNMNGIYLFTLGRIPVFISLWYVLLVGYFSYSMGMANGLLWAAAITVSVLVHEFGHGLVARHYDLNPTILLHGWGGLCAHRPAQRDRHSALILAAGPGAGLVLGALTYVVALVVEAAQPGWLGARPMAGTFVQYMLWVNLFWSFVNLIPMWPLDGGQLFGLGVKQKLNVLLAHRVTHGLGAAIGVAAALYGLFVMNSFFIGIISAFLAWGNVKRLQEGPQNTVAVLRARTNKHASELYGRALRSMEDHDWAEAARLGHQMRGEQLSDQQLAQAWELLSVATTNMAEYEEALTYLQRAPDTEPVRAARTRCLEQLGRPEDSNLH
ncbi:MAG: hypothetical protein AUK47_18675 [Deltaproteobacteria bacterium CG2_30_63_29]|nr:MAG: hypothetical protein AUK47_18675 [Deltaproteobacteria bacterium CG2_30_63_29]PIW00345.1 MAG: hypothetical protein COW42_08085 [Deltaproteobacteria bacterium CG17_big_fil_post_rev_8_21_14_2_50_63_7]PJB34370.1 MAG: hypothetical protein CO108_28465 [Deltaproteobacteria bacterium CG_4_9_14_3_um_filter_63_12]